MAIAILVVVVYVAEGPMQWCGRAGKLSAVLCGCALMLACPLSAQSANYDQDNPSFNGVNLKDRLKMSEPSPRFKVQVMDPPPERSELRNRRNYSGDSSQWPMIHNINSRYSSCNKI